MVFIDATVQNNSIAQRGVFTNVPIQKGTVIGHFLQGVKMMSEEAYQAEQAKGNTLIIKTACRFVGHHFLFCETIGVDEYYNHSFDPNVLYHCGVLFAKRYIEVAEELTLNYHYILAHKDVCRFTDASSGIEVDGLQGTEALKRSTEELLELLKETELK